MSGSILINEEADRVNSYNVWNYGEGHDSYYSSMLVDLTKPPDKVSSLSSVYNFPNLCVHYFITVRPSLRPGHTLTNKSATSSRLLGVRQQHLRQQHTA